MGNDNSTVRESKIQYCEKTFILFGKSNSGKSALGNLLLGPNATTYFSTHLQPESSGHTEKMQSGEAEIDARIVYGESYTGHNRVKIQVIDQPGCNDNDYFEFSIQCLKKTKSEINATFLFVINLTSSYFSQDEFFTFMKFAEILADNQYCVFSNAILVFTHADILEKGLKKMNLEELVHEKLKQEDYGYIQEMLELMGNRHILINAVNYEETNRNNIFRKLFQLTRPKLNAYIEGSHSFMGRKLKQLFGEDRNAVFVKNNSHDCDIEYNFNLELNTIRKFDKYHTLKEEIINALNKLNAISNGITANVILINLEEMLSKEILDRITDLPNMYNLGEKSKHYFWNYACIVFKVRKDSKEYVTKEIDASPKLKNLSRKVQSRYCWITDRTSPGECHKRIGNLVKEVATYNKWKTYSDGAVVVEIRDRIQKYFTHKHSNDTEVYPSVTGAEMKSRVSTIRLCESIGPRNTLLSIRNRFWDTDIGISTQIGHFIWKNINADIAKRFNTQYPVSTVSRIAIETYIDFCLQALRTI